jgi:hypothetical protein
MRIPPCVQRVELKRTGKMVVVCELKHATCPLDYLSAFENVNLKLNPRFIFKPRDLIYMLL